MALLTKLKKNRLKKLNESESKSVDIIKDNQKVCNYIDIPLQHINNEIFCCVFRNYYFFVGSQ